ncbi:MAG: hypothetical protein J0H29_21300, partial [Sphingobacteriales bacterium]|nr:hypothetical protein [Sphingobacteriales bacterium]
MQPDFTINEIIQRSTIHDSYGGSRQSGISVSATHPYIFIFSGTTGHKHGYKDQWENENVFSYTGEGQTGNMNFVKGNLALLEHKKNNKSIFLFEYVAKGFVQYKGELELIDYDFFTGPDREGKERNAIKFFFKKKGITLSYREDFQELIMEDPPAEYGTQIPNETERKGLVTSRIGQGAYRKSV